MFMSVVVVTYRFGSRMVGCLLEKTLCSRSFLAVATMVMSIVDLNLRLPSRVPAVLISIYMLTNNLLTILTSTDVWSTSLEKV